MDEIVKFLFPLESGITAVAVQTPGFSRLPSEQQSFYRKEAEKNLNPKTNWVIFGPDIKERHFEDEGRTLLIPTPQYKERVYAILDDYKGAEEEAFGYSWVVTFLLAEEY
jgi:hypothetical protein